MLPRFQPETRDPNRAFVDRLGDDAASKLTVHGARYPEALERMTGR